MLALFTVLSLATGVVTVLALDHQLTTQVDDQLAAATQRIFVSQEPLDLKGDDSGAARGPRGPGSEGLIAFFPYSSTALDAGAATSSDGGRPSLTGEQLAILAGADLGTDPVNIDLGGDIGSYRVVARQATIRTRGLVIPGTLVVGLPTSPSERTVHQMVFIAISTIVAGVALVGLVGTWIVRRNLEPLRRVAATATRVSRLPLASGQVALAERVPPRDTDRRTEVGQVGAAFNEMLDHVGSALTVRHRSEQRVRQFVADASHELRTPLAAIKGYAELSRRASGEVPDSVTHAMGRIESEADRMSSLVEDLLLLARLDAGRPLEDAPVDMSMLVVNAVSDAHAAAPGHAWDLDLPPEPVEVRGDEARLHQVVANLLANARAHTPAGTRVTTSVRTTGPWVRVAVHDDGPGVPVDLQPNVFERFARGDDARARARGSTGLGLSIVSAVTRAHGGRVELTSRPGDTTFSVLLPTDHPCESTLHPREAGVGH
ncbi:MAG: HAMP domain-containing histidine kinase [Micrococcales bacterium]|nr:HAMP domain-containing histidine kinase [Micrococcales bacterium]